MPIMNANMKKKSQYWRSKVTKLNWVAGLFQFRVSESSVAAK